MKGFLDEIAEHLSRNHSVQELKDIVMVLPSKRGGLYLKKALARVFPTPFFAPKIYSLEEFVLLATESKLMAPTDLLIEAYQTFKSVEPNLSLDKFMGWGPIMLKDFDILDMYLVPPKDLFDYLSEAKSIDRWAEELGTEDKENLLTENTKAYFKLHENLLEVYIRLQARLEKKNLYYRGQLFRKLVENLNAGKPLPISFSKCYFLGFNALSKSEEEIIRKILASENSAILWDTDAYYLENPYHRAGYWLRNYADLKGQNSLGQGDFLWKNDYYRNSPKEVSIVKVKNRSTQVYWALNKIKEWELTYGNQEDIALVLGDEQLLGSFLDYLGNFKDRLNITMGYPLRNTQVFRLIEDFWELYINKDLGKFDSDLIQKFLSNPLIDSYLKKRSSQELSFSSSIHEIFKLYPLFIPLEKLQEYEKEFPLFKAVFLPDGLKFHAILQALSELLIHILKNLSKDFNPEQREAVFLAKELIDKLKDSFDAEELNDLKVGRSFLRQNLSTVKISFEGQVKRTLNVMGLLETRTLDFDRVMILSVNEEVLPRSSRRDSLIPYDISTMKAFDLPTRTQADAVTSYHFHRLLQRPKEVILMTILPSEKGLAKEESRFIQQLRLDWPKINPHLSWKEIHVGTNRKEIEPMKEASYSIRKSPEIIQEIKGYLRERGLSPTSFSNLVSCHLKFYWSNIIGIREDRVQDEELGTDALGSWIHKILEMGNKELIQAKQSYSKEWYQKKIQSLEDELITSLNELKRDYGSFDIERGFNFVLREVVSQSLMNYYQNQLKEGQVYSLPLFAEEEFNSYLEIMVENEPIQLKMKGHVDLVDVLGNEIRILDYKTGAMDGKDLKIHGNTIENFMNEEFSPKLFQLMTYFYLLNQNLKGTETKPALVPYKNQSMKIVPGIISTRKVSEGIFTTDFTGELANEEFYQSILRAHLEQLLDPNRLIERTENKKVCAYCSFSEICKRNT